MNLSNASPGSPITYIFNYSNSSSPTTCSDTFESDTAGGAPAGWVSSGGAWTIGTDNGPTTTGSLAVTGVSTTGTFPNLLNNCAGQVGDGFIQADMKIGAPSTVQQGVLLWRFTGTDTPAFTNGSSYQAIIGAGTTGNVIVGYYDNTAGKFTNVAAANYTITTGTWYTVQFGVTGSSSVTLSLAINGVTVITSTAVTTPPTSPINSGFTGLQVNNGSSVEFDNIQIVKSAQIYGGTITDTLPAGLTYVSAGGSTGITSTVSGQQVVWNLGNEPSGASGAVTVAGVVSNCGVTLVNTGEGDSITPWNHVVSNSVATTIIVCTPTPTATYTHTYTPTVTNTPVPPTATYTFTNTPVPPTATYTFTNTPVPPTATNTFTNTPAPPTATFTFTNTPVPPTATNTFTNTPVPPTPTYTFTNTPVPPTATFTFTNIPVPPTATNTFTNTPVPPTATYTFTNTPVPPTVTNTFTNTPVPPTATFTFTNTPVPPTATDTFTNTPVPPTATYTFTNTPVPPTVTNTFTNTPVPPTATFTFTNTPVPPTATDTFTNTPVPPTVTNTFTNTPVPPTATFTFTNTPVPYDKSLSQYNI